MDRTNRLLIAAALLLLSLAGLAGFFAGQARSQQIRELKDRLDKMEQILQEESSMSGGAERDLQPTLPVSDESSRWLFPVAERDFRRYTSPLGARISPITQTWRDHEGLDIATVWRAEVVAIADGVVTDHWPVGRYGNITYRGHDVYGGFIEIRHENGWVSRYAHLHVTYTNVIRIGAQVQAGQVIGRVGGTGRADGEHLHFEMRDATGALLNPLLYIPNVEEEK